LNIAYSTFYIEYAIITKKKEESKYYLLAASFNAAKAAS
jgi:hypothetical protein